MSETLMTPTAKMGPQETAEFLAWLRECAAESIDRIRPSPDTLKRPSDQGRAA